MFLFSEQHLQQQVTLLGALPNPYPYMRQCDIYVQTDDPDDFISLTEDPNCHLAFDVLCRKLNDPDMLNRVGKKAIEQNLETARQYATEEDLVELGVI